MMIFRFVLFLKCVTYISTIENLALQKPAWQENNWQDKETDWGADKAVDGRYTDRSAGGNQCTISAGGQTAEWGVDLGRVVSISYIKLYYRTDNKPGSFFDRFAGYFLYVSNSTFKKNGRLCFHDHQNINGTPTDDQRINCSVYGRYVIYYNERRPDVTYPSYYSPDAYNELCEVEVYGCYDTGYYGNFCNQSCPVKCQGQQCDAVTGNCLNGFVQGYQGPHCSYLNLALGRPAWLQHKWSFTRRIWGAEKAVDGQYTDRSAAGNQCTISGPGYQTAEWRVDLQDIVSISHIQIYYRTENTPGPGAYMYYMTFAGFFVYVSNDTSRNNGILCFHQIQNKTGTPTEDQTISCPVDGRYVIYYNERRPDVTYPGYYSQYAYTYLCELEVYGCPGSRYFGKYCEQSCPENCQELRCNMFTGNCFKCKPRYDGSHCQNCKSRMYGALCNLTCGHCLNDTQCHQINGSCVHGCAPGYEGPSCFKPCDDGIYGSNCNKTCGHCLDGTSCHHGNGHCLQGCSPGYEGSSCYSECDDGKYGANCNETCGHCLNESQCHHINGSCLQGCSPGYKGELCKKCDVGMFGVNCNESCGHCQNDGQCQHVNGTCLQGCSVGYQGVRCTDECDGGMYGATCGKTCGHCLDNLQCHHLNGVCLDGCSSGYKGSLCIKKCEEGKYGLNCSNNCGNCLEDTQCHHVNGSCLQGCSCGYQGMLCTQKNQTCSTDCVSQTCHHESGVCLTSFQKRPDTHTIDVTTIIICVVVSLFIVFIGSVLNFLIWRRNGNKAKESRRVGQKINLNELSAVHLADQNIERDKTTSPYTELGTLNKSDTYEDLHICADREEKN